MPHPLRRAADSKTETYINTPTQIAQILLECFDKSALALFRRYLDHHPQVRKWIIAADFALHDKDRPLDCFAFTILPYDAWPAEIEKDVAQALPKDLKKSKALDEAGVDWLRDRRRFHVMITVNKDRMPFSNGPGTDPLAIAREHIDKTLAQAAAVGSPDETIMRRCRFWRVPTFGDCSPTTGTTKWPTYSIETAANTRWATTYRPRRASMTACAGWRARAGFRGPK
jgi:hypothetical protein